MGYRNPRNIYKITWPEGHRLHGLHIWAYSCPLGQMLEVSKLGAKMKAGGGLDAEVIERVQDIFAPCLVRWDLEDDCFDATCPDGPGEHVHPTPVGRAGLNTLDVVDLLSVLTAWAQRISGVATPLAKPSIPNGIPMTPAEPSMAAP